MSARTVPIAFPYAIDGRGRTAESDPQSHLRDLIESVLFTAPGERVMRPTFGSGALRLVFAPNSDQLAATLKMIVMSSLTQWLGDLIQVADVEIDNNDSTLSIKVSYVVRSTNETADATFESTL
jgi:phage baseplate assembly protein W